MSYDYDDYTPYVSVAERRMKAEREVARLRKKGHVTTPVVIEGRKLATTFWGQAWNDNLEAYSDYASRLPRGRSYVRNGSVVDLQVDGGEVKALVMGSKLYEVTVKVAPLSKTHWGSICKDCAGTIDSLVELLQGRLSKAVMARVSQQKTGLFPAPGEVELSCSCPDGASMCKHVAAVLYGIGARLDGQPAQVFRLRSVDEDELIASAAKGDALATEAPPSVKILGGGDLSALFGLEMEGLTADAGSVENSRGPKRSSTRNKLLDPLPSSVRLPARRSVSKRLAPGASVKEPTAVSRGRAADSGRRRSKPKG